MPGVICALVVVPIAIGARPLSSVLLNRAATLSGLRVRGPVHVVREAGAGFDADVMRAVERDYPRSLQRLDASLYVGLGLLPGGESIRPALRGTVAQSRAYYDPAARVLRVRQSPAPTRRAVLRELVRALVDQNFGLRRATAVRRRDRDASLAAATVIDGVADAASGLRPPPVHGSRFARFLALEENSGSDVGRTLVGRLRYIGGTPAVASALRSFPATTEQVLHLDKFLEREGPMPVALTPVIDDLRLTASETFGELDVRALLRAFDVADADAVADGWSGGRIALYTTATGQQSVALVLRWDTPADAAEWRADAPDYVAAAFPAAQERLCPAVDHCWLTGDRELATVTADDVTVFASGADAELVAAALIKG